MQANYTSKCMFISKRLRWTDLWILESTSETSCIYVCKANVDCSAFPRAVVLSGRGNFWLPGLTAALSFSVFFSSLNLSQRIDTLHSSVSAKQVLDPLNKSMATVSGSGTTRTLYRQAVVSYHWQQLVGREAQTENPALPWGPPSVCRVYLGRRSCRKRRKRSHATN